MAAMSGKCLGAEMGIPLFQKKVMGYRAMLQQIRQCKKE
jgi:hypothetical protein